MKVRILNNTIRFRVSMDEMKQLAHGEEVSSSLDFPSTSLGVKVIPHATGNRIDFNNNEIKLLLDQKTLTSLHHGQDVGFAFTTESINVLFEKDFKCLTDRGEDESNLYKNPQNTH